ncbi:MULTISPECIES: hypothetical protein [unclassified Bradyrhizobium]|uniref:hypothetical protein n=1 Tax=unclassified Bradyrhizobium TaxID=2631580 RepID=UPI002302FEEC|nr:MULTISPECIES: hypothetical protein [unclassified Bradyrhizobium]
MATLAVQLIALWADNCAQVVCEPANDLQQSPFSSCVKERETCFNQTAGSFSF